MYGNRQKGRYRGSARGEENRAEKPRAENVGMEKRKRTRN